MATRKPRPSRTVRSPRQSQVKQAIGVIRRFYQLGQKSLRSDSGRLPYGGVSIAAKKLGVSPMMLRNARRFAGSDGSGYTSKQLDALCDSCRRHGFAIGIAQVIRLLSIQPVSLRTKMQHQMIVEGWTYRRLNIAIKLQLGNREPWAGRRGLSPGSVNEALVELLNITERWQRFHRKLKETPATGGNNGNGQLWSELHKDVQRAIGKAKAPIEGVCAAVLKSLPEV